MRQAAKVSIATLFCALHYSTEAFIQRRPETLNSSPTSMIPRFVGAPASQDDRKKQSFFLSLEEINPIITLNKDKASMKVINAFGLWCALVSLALAPIWMLAMTSVKMLHNTNENFDPQRAIYDK